MNRKVLKATVGFLIYVAFVVGVYAVVKLTIPSTGIISGQLSANPSSIDWGLVDAGVPVTRTVTLTNEGGATVSNINMTVSNVVGLTDFTVTWNQEGGSVGSGASVDATFTLTVNAYTQTSFSFDIYIQEGP